LYKEVLPGVKPSTLRNCFLNDGAFSLPGRNLSRNATSCKLQYLIDKEGATSLKPLPVY